MGALVAKPLEKANLKITDVDVFSVEMQNPDITKAAGAGNVPESNYKMIGALAAMRGDIDKNHLNHLLKKKDYQDGLQHKDTFLQVFHM